MLDALAYLKAARSACAPAALEVSRSGVGAHVWTFFTDPVSAATARWSAPGSCGRRSRSGGAWIFGATTVSSRHKTCFWGAVRAT